MRASEVNFEEGTAGRGWYVAGFLLVPQMLRMVAGFSGMDSGARLEGVTTLGLWTTAAVAAIAGCLVPERPEDELVLEDPHSGELVRVSPDHAIVGVPLRIATPVLIASTIVAWCMYLLD